MAISNYPSGFRGGALIKEVPLFDAIAGNVYWVDSGTGGAGNPGTFNKPLNNLDNAINKCTANNGDYIFLKPGHTEAITAAGGAVFDTAGITVVGIGSGTDQPQIRFTTAAGADIDITAANTRFFNVRFTAAFADVTAAIDVGASAHNLEFHDCLIDEEEAGENYVVFCNIADGADGLKMYNCRYIGNDASNDHCLEFAGTHENVEIVGNRFIHETAQTATVAIIESATQMVNCLIAHNYFHSESSAVAAAFVVLTGTTNNGWAHNNMLSSVDTDATAANFAAAFDVTGLGAFENYAVADTDGLAVNSFLTAEDLT